MPLPAHLSKEGVAEKKLRQIPQGKRTGIVRAMIDTRGEPDWNLGCPTLKMALPAGDVMCTCSDGATVLIERKTPDDFLGTLAKNRLFPQVARMVQVTPWSYVLITGQFYRLRNGMVKVGGRETGWNWDAVQGALLTIQEMGCGVIHCNDNDFEGAVKRLCNRDRSVKRITPPKDSTWLTFGEAMIAALPGIGFERVEALAKLGSAAVMLEWLTDLTNTTKIPGVADGTKKRVIKALGLDQERLAIVPATCTEQGYTPDFGFIAAADKTAMAYWKNVAISAAGDPEDATRRDDEEKHGHENPKQYAD